MTDEQLAKLEQLSAAAESAPWRVDHTSMDSKTIALMSPFVGFGVDDRRQFVGK
jgi:hypothetical protein